MFVSSCSPLVPAPWPTRQLTQLLAVAGTPRSRRRDPLDRRTIDLAYVFGVARAETKVCRRYPLTIQPIKMPTVASSLSSLRALILFIPLLRFFLCRSCFGFAVASTHGVEAPGEPSGRMPSRRKRTRVRELASGPMAFIIDADTRHWPDIGAGIWRAAARQHYLLFRVPFSRTQPPPRRPGHGPNDQGCIVQLADNNKQHVLRQ